MSRTGVKHWIESKLRYIPNTYAESVHLISSKCRGCAYVKNTTYKEVYKGRKLYIYDDSVHFHFDDLSIEYNSHNIVIRSVNRQYHWSSRGIGIVFDPQTKTAINSITLTYNTDDLWARIQDIIRS